MRKFLKMALFLLVGCTQLQAAELFGWTGCMDGDYGTSVRECSLLIEKERDRGIAARAFFFRGEAYRREGEKENAIADYREAARLDPKFSDAYQRLAIVNKHLAQFGSAIANAKKAYALHKSPVTASLLKSLGVIPSRLKEHERSRAAD